MPIPHCDGKWYLNSRGHLCSRMTFPYLSRINISVPPVLAAGPVARCVVGAHSSSTPARAPGVRSGRSCHPAGMAQGALSDGHAGNGARLHHGYASPLRGLAPHGRVQPGAIACVAYCEVCWAPCQPGVTPAQRRTPYARSSVLLPWSPPPRATGPSSRAGGTVLVSAAGRVRLGVSGQRPGRRSNAASGTSVVRSIPPAALTRLHRSSTPPVPVRGRLPAPVRPARRPAGRVDRHRPEAPRTGPLPSPYEALTPSYAMPMRS